MIRIFEYGKIPAEKIFERQEYITGVSGPVEEIIANVRENGDKAVLEYTEKFDKAAISSLEVSEAEINEAFAAVDKEFLETRYIIINRKAMLSPTNPYSAVARNSNHLIKFMLVLKLLLFDTT